MADEPLKHLLRPMPPWVTETVTECGRGGNDVAAITTPEHVRAMISRYGKQRTAFMVCMTCMDAYHGATSWESAPGEIVLRWLERSRYRTPRSGIESVTKYLYALAALVKAHEEEFRALVDSDGTTDLSARRKRR